MKWNEFHHEMGGVYETDNSGLIKSLAIVGRLKDVTDDLIGRRVLNMSATIFSNRTNMSATP